MDLGCFDLGCIEKQTTDNNANGSPNPTTTSNPGKNKAVKEVKQSNVNPLNKFTSNIKKPPRRKSSPLNWFPRKKVDSYLERKIKLLQEVGGMNSSLDETLGDSNPHYSRVLREKIAVREAAQKAMEARKAALVEASWCRILRAARIDIKESETLLLKAEKNAAEAIEAATAIGVLMYDIPECSRKHYEIETSAVNGGESTTHTVTASFETAFEVDKQVAAAVKAAFIRLANCPSINKDECKELLKKISQNPDTGENNQELSDFSSECESDTGSELELGPHKDNFSSRDLDGETEVASATRERKYKKRQLLKKFNSTYLVDMMLERLRCLQEDELASLATIVATCGLSAALAEAENLKQTTLAPPVNFPRRVSNIGGGQVRGKHVKEELPSLDKFLVKRLTRLERDVQEAKNASKNKDKFDNEEIRSVDNNASSSEATDLGSILVKHTSKFEKEIEETKRKYGKLYESNGKKSERVNNWGAGQKNDLTEVPSLDKFLIKHVSKLEREVQEARNKAAATSCIAKSEENSSCSDRDQVGKENIDLNETGNREMDMKQKEAEASEALLLHDGNEETKETENSLDKIMVKPIHWSEREKIQSMGSENGLKWHNNKSKHGGNSVTDCESLDKVLVKRVSRLEKEKMRIGAKEEVMKVKKHVGNTVADCESLDKVLVKHVSRLEREKMDSKEEVMKVKRRTDETVEMEKSQGSLDQVLVKHKSRLEREKMAVAAVQLQPLDDQQQIKPVMSRREAREKELQEAWGGLSLGNSIRPRLSRLQRDKAAWIKAEEEERMRVIEEV